MGKNKVLCVLRTSTLQQEIESQKTDMRAYLKTKGYDDSDVVWLACRGASARKANIAYLEMIDTIKSRITEDPNLNTVAVWHINRLGRQMSYIYDLVEFFKETKTQLYVKNPDLTLLNPDLTYNTASDIVFAVFSAMIPCETQELADKLQRGREHRKSLGKVLGSRTAFGFSKTDDGYLAPHPSNMEIVKKVFELYATGIYSLEGLYKALKAEGVNSFNNTRILSRILSNDAYVPYIDPIVREKVLSVKNKHLSVWSRESKHTYLLHHLIRCGACGKHYITDSGRYLCITQKHHRTCPNSFSVDSHNLDKLIWWVVGVLYTADQRKGTNVTVDELRSANDVLQSKIRTAMLDIGKLGEKLDNTKELYSNADISKEKYEKRKAQINEEIVRTKEMLDGYKRDIQRNDKHLKFLTTNQKPIDVIRSLDLVIEKKREIVRRYVDSIELRRQAKSCRSIVVCINLMDGRQLHYIMDSPTKNRGLRYWEMTDDGLKEVWVAEVVSK